MLVYYWFLNRKPGLIPVSHNNEQLKLKWGASGVTVNSELKLLQYYMDHNLKLEDTEGSTFKRSGTVESVLLGQSNQNGAKTSNHGTRKQKQINRYCNAFL